MRLLPDDVYQQIVDALNAQMDVTEWKEQEQANIMSVEALTTLRSLEPQEVDELKADAEKWRAYKARKDAVLAAGMGRNPLRSYE